MDIAAFLDDPSKCPGKVAVALSALLPATADESWKEIEHFMNSYGKVMAGGPTATELLAQVDEDFEEFAPVLKLSKPSISLVELYEQSNQKAAV